MKFGPVPVDDALGAILGHGQTIAGRRIGKGQRLTEEHLDAARADGLSELIVARLDDGDTGEDDAADAVAVSLSGSGLRVTDAVHGRADLVATEAGLLVMDPKSVIALNLIDEAITVATLPAFSRVTPGMVVATVKIICYAVEGPALAAVADHGQTSRLSIAPFTGATVDLIHTRLPGLGDKVIRKTSEVTRDRLAALGAIVGRETCCRHDMADITALLASPTQAGITLVAGASATVDRGDVLPAAIVAAGGEVERLGMPVEPGNLLCLGRIGARMIVGLPGCARSPRRNGIDMVLERLLAGLPVDSAAIAEMAVGGLLAESADRAARHSG